MKLFRALFVFDLLVALATGVVFCFGVAEAVVNGHVSTDDLLIWPPLLTGIGAVLGCGWWLKSRVRLRAANAVLLIMALPGALAGLFLLAVLIALSRPGAFR